MSPFEKRLQQLEALEAELYGQEPEETEEEIEAAWLLAYAQREAELAPLGREDLLNHTPDDLIIWARLHRPDVVPELEALYSFDPLEQLWAVGSRKWYLDMCRLIQVPFQRKYWMDVSLPRPPHIYHSDDPNYHREPKRSQEDGYTAYRRKLGEIP